MAIARRHGDHTAIDVTATVRAGHLHLDAWAGCIAGAVTRPPYRSLLTDVGFVDVDIVDNHAVADGHWSVFGRTRTRDVA